MRGSKKRPASGSILEGLWPVKHAHTRVMNRCERRLYLRNRYAQTKHLVSVIADISDAGHLLGYLFFHTFTRSQPPGWTGYARRIDQPMLREVAGPLGKTPQVFICGPTLLVESVANALVQIGIPAAQVRTERFGPSGGTA